MAAGLALLAPDAGVAADSSFDPKERTFSASKQFVIYGSTQKERAEVAKRADRARMHLNDRVLGVSDKWEHNIVVRFLTEEEAPKTGSAVRVALFDTGTGDLKIQIDIAPGEKHDSKELDRALLQALLLEQAFRKEKFVAGNPYRFAPSWLVEAIAELLHSPENSLPPEIFEKLIEAGGPPRLELFLGERATRLDKTSLALYRARAAALLSAILTQRNGRLELIDYIELTGRKEATAELFLDSFRDSVGTPDRLMRIWTLALAKFSAKGRTELLTMGETARRLKALIEIKTPKDSREPEGESLYGAEALIHLSRSREGRFSLQNLTNRVNGLLWQAHPLFRPMTQEYYEILQRLGLGKRGGIEKRIEENNELINAMVERTNEIEDYLNWFQASRIPNASGEFDDTFSENEAELTAEQLRQSDPIHAYLDALESRGWR